MDTLKLIFTIMLYTTGILLLLVVILSIISTFIDKIRLKKTANDFSKSLLNLLEEMEKEEKEKPKKAKKKTTKKAEKPKEE